MISSVSIQGVKGSFHHIIAQQYFGIEMPITECLTFDEVIKNISSSKTDAGIMALENSIAGSILPNYALIDKNELHIVGEQYLDIQHNLLALKNQVIEDIKEVHSHPMALLQCKEFLKKYPHIKLVEDKDTALVAQRISEQQLKGIASIASVEAAILFDLKIMERSIQTIKHNQTRFVIIKKLNHEIELVRINKASLKFVLSHNKGSLAKILNILSDCGLNLTKIQSLPIIETPWRYAFFIDVTFEKYTDYEKVKNNLEVNEIEFKILGEYIKSRV
jgi:prephenate dehydratase